MVQAGKSVQLAPLVSILGDIAGASGCKTTRGVSWQRIGAASWASQMFWLTLVVILGAVGYRVGPRLRKKSGWELPVQGQLSARHGHALSYTHFTPGWCIQNWGITRGTGPVFLEGPAFLGCSSRQRRRRQFRYSPKGGRIDGNILNSDIILILYFFAILQIIFFFAESILWVGKYIRHWLGHVDAKKSSNFYSLNSLLILSHINFNSWLLYN